MALYKDFIKAIEKDKGIHIKVKGQAVGKPNAFNYNLIIIKMGLLNHFIYGKSIFETMNENPELMNYQIIKKRTAQTKYMDMTNNIALPDKVLRLFPVTQGGIKILTDTMKKIPDVPDSALIYKDNIQSLTINDIPHLDLNYYSSKFQSDLQDGWLI